ncbi:AAA family ATPase [Dendryphion nanum]|uniref:AAA family ATPase n=1 Tax=Dendryphion nanum TaxID=256645 RepID=A0A9P9IDG6_9PLEO|nr:AAA family ATPase [Dendryphion nanum]
MLTLLRLTTPFGQSQQHRRQQRRQKRQQPLEELEELEQKQQQKQQQQQQQQQQQKLQVQAHRLHLVADQQMNSSHTSSQPAPSRDSPFFVLARVGIPEEKLNDLATLETYIRDLQNKAEKFSKIQQTQHSPQYCIIYRVINEEATNMFLDPPQWDIVEGLQSLLTGGIPLTNLKIYLRNHPDVEFVVYRDYNQAAIPVPERGDSGITDTPVPHTQESIDLCSEELSIGISSFINQMPGFDTMQGIKGPKELQAPYLVFYHSREKFEELLKKLPRNRRQKLNILRDYVLSEYGKEYKEVDNLLNRGLITPKYVMYLFKPRELMVAGTGGDARGAVTRGIWKQTDQRPFLHSSFGPMGGNNMDQSKCTWTISAWSWEWSEVLFRKLTTFGIELENTESKEMKIEELEVRPLRFVDRSLIELLQRRGGMFWKCRIQRFVSYHDKKDGELRSSADDRYMIDHKTYLSLHSKVASQYDKGGPDILEGEAFNRDEPPDEDFYFLVPPTVKGYNFKTKKWQDLQVDNIREVIWNKEAFNDLVLHSDQNSDTSTKELLQALITKQIEAGKSTDMIQGKGSGLILLLHGAPGTGKTLTAESVAEIAEKPLYPITCGDVGTEAESVERYLESAFNLGKKWDCVILLDEADVFLAERNLEDLRRNAIVSAFLRVLEYAEGILILTSNRVGTFDEAFFSRIHLALHYPDLTIPLRKKIWKNFINRLRNLEEENVDFNDLMKHVDELAENKLNGRQIRNIITTARQHSKWKNLTLNYEFLDQDIRITGRFEEYMSKLRGGHTEGEIAEDSGLRLAEKD